MIYKKCELELPSVHVFTCIVKFFVQNKQELIRSFKLTGSSQTFGSSQQIQNDVKIVTTMLIHTSYESQNLLD